MDQESRIYRVNNVDLNVLVAGEGPPVMLVHGFPDDHNVWRHQIPVLLAAGYCVIAPDTRGCGQSEILDNVLVYSMNNLVDDLSSLLDCLEIPKVQFVGHDWGAIIGWNFTCLVPERVTSYAALSVGHPAAFAGTSLLEKLRSYYVLLMQIPGLPELLMPLRDWWLLEKLSGYPEEMPEWKKSLGRPGRLRAAINYYRANPDMLKAHDMPAASAPVMGLWSDGDAFLVERQMIGSVDHVQQSFRYERINCANHWLQLDAPDQVNTLLLEFLSESRHVEV